MLNQTDPWAGEFGDAYHARQTDAADEAVKRSHLWRPVLDLLPRKNLDILEIGAGTGANLRAIQDACKAHHLCAIEPNKSARDHLQDFYVLSCPAEDIDVEDESFDLVFTYGMLIHQPDPLPAMREMYRVSRRYIMCAEYFAPKREPIPYRDGVPLFRDDFGSLWMDNFNVRSVGSGFCWKRTTGLDNVTWWLLKKATMVPLAKQHYDSCGFCSGTGKGRHGPCLHCDGTGIKTFKTPPRRREAARSRMRTKNSG